MIKHKFLSVATPKKIEKSFAKILGSDFSSLSSCGSYTLF